MKDPVRITIEQARAIQLAMGQIDGLEEFVESWDLKEIRFTYTNRRDDPPVEITFCDGVISTEHMLEYEEVIRQRIKQLKEEVGII